MRLPSGDTATPWPASIPLISPTTLFVAGSMMWMLSPAEFVWMIRSFDSCAARKEKDTVHRAIPARAARPPRNACLFVIFVILFSETSHSPGGIHQETGPFIGRQVGYPPLLCLLSQDKCFQCQPLRVLLRAELLAAAVMGIAASLLGKRMLEQWALQQARRGHPLDQLEVLARLLLVPGRAPGPERHQV